MFSLPLVNSLHLSELLSQTLGSDCDLMACDTMLLIPVNRKTAAPLTFSWLHTEWELEVSPSSVVANSEARDCARNHPICANGYIRVWHPCWERLSSCTSLNNSLPDYIYPGTHNSYDSRTAFDIPILPCLLITLPGK